MRISAVILMMLLGVWIIARAPVPMIGLGPLKPSPDVPTYQEALQDMDPEVRAQKYGSAPEDPERRRLRLAVVDAAEQARMSPCNEDFRQRLVELSKKFLDVSRTRSRMEVTIVSGRKMNVSEKLDKTALDAINSALTDGFFRPEDFTGRYKQLGQMAQYYGRGNPCQ